MWVWRAFCEDMFGSREACEGTGTCMGLEMVMEMEMVGPCGVWRGLSGHRDMWSWRRL